MQTTRPRVVVLPLSSAIIDKTTEEARGRPLWTSTADPLAGIAFAIGGTRLVGRQPQTASVARSR
jgi:hypothetical protein